MVYSKESTPFIYFDIIPIKEELYMKTFAIHLREINDVYKLVNTLVAYDGAVDLG